MKPQLTLLALLLFLGSLSAQVKFKVKLLTDNQTYQVIFKPSSSWANPMSTTNAGQVTLRMPKGSFVAGTITNLKGTWEVLSTVSGPTEAPNFDYVTIYLKTPIPGSQITYTNGVEIPMFNIRNNGTCPGVVEIVDNATDPFIEPNSQNVGISNYLTVLGAGQNDAFAGDYTSFPANCQPMNNPCNIEVFDVALCAPTACEVADGKVVIDAVSNNGLPLQYTLNFGSGNNTTWTTLGAPNNNVFSNLSGGDTYYIAVRDLIGCEYFIGEYQLPGPLAAIILSVDQNNPDCGGTNGSIVINAISSNGGTLEYAMSASGPWQSSSTFSGLAEGTYSFFVRDITNNCEDPVGTYTLTGCVPPSCNFTYDLVHLGNGKYEFLLHTDTTLSGPINNFVSSLQTTLKVPTGGFVLSNLTESIQGPDFDILETVTAPVEDPQHDYITIGMLTATNQIPIVDGGTVHLFTFDNTGTCVGDSIRFMLDNDPYQASTAGQFMVVSGAPNPTLCLANNAVICEAAPPAAPDCIITYDLVHLGNGLYEFRMLTDTTLIGTLNSSTSSLQTTIKVATGGFQLSSLTSLVPSADFVVTEMASAPVQSPNFDYITIGLVSATTAIPYTTGNTVSLFRFENTGTCMSDSVYFMLDGDPFQGVSTAGQFMVVSGLVGLNFDICLAGTSEVCDNMDDPCAGFAPGFTATDACEGTPITFTNTTISNDPVTSWSWDFGDNTTATGQSPAPHTYSSSGNFEVSLTVTTQNGCNATFMDFVTVFPSPGDAPVSSYDICNGVGVTLESPDNITSATWSPATGLSCTACPDPVANPSATTVYTATFTNVYGCTSTSQVTVNVISKPIINNVAVNQISDCSLTDGSIVVTASGVSGVEYGLDNGSGIVWQSGNSFNNLVAGSYTLFVRNTDDSCPVAFNGNPIVIVSPVAPALVGVVTVPPVGCLNNGSITINASGGTAPLQYSINGTNFQSSNIFNGLGAGTYTPQVRNANGSCLITGNPVVFTQPAPPSLNDLANQSICVGSTTTVTVQSSTAIASFQITGTGVYSNAVVNGNTLTFSASANAVGTTSYTVQVTDGNNCTATKSFNLTGVAVPTASFTVSPTVCVNGNVVLDFNGVSLPTADLNWSLAGATIVSQSQATASQPARKTMVVKWTTSGTKTVTLQVDNGGCTVSTQLTINLADFDPSATFAITPAGCGTNSGAINLTVNGGPYNYSWNNQSTSQDPANLLAGTYTVTITEPNSGCSTSETAVVTGSQPVAINNTATTPAPDCAGGSGGGSLTVSITGGTAPFTYSIPGQTPVSGNLTSVTFNDLSAGAYQLTVTDASGCSDLETITVQAVSPTLTTSIDIVDAGCTSNDGSLTATIVGGQAPYTYTLYENNVIGGTLPVNGTSVSLNALTPGNYLLIFEDANGCVAPIAGTVERKEGVFSAAAAVTNASCGTANGQIALTNLPTSSSLQWENSNGDDLGAAGTLTGLAAGIYYVTLTEINGCTSDSSFVVSSTGGQVVSLGQMTPATCGLANGSFTFTVTNGNAFQYDILGQNIQPGFGTPGVPVVITGLAEGAIVLKVTDLLQSACKVFEAVVIPGGDAFQTSATVTLSTGCGNENGQICLEITGGTAPFTVVASDGTIEPGNAPNRLCVTGLYEGTVNVTITDAANCTKTITQFMGDFDEPNITADSVEVVQPLCPGDLGSILSNASVSYQVFNSATNAFLGNTPLTDLDAGTYRVVYAVNGCTDSLANLVIGSVDDWVIVSSIEKEICDQGNGSVALSLAGATAPYTIEWSNDSTSATITGLQSGTYTASITDDNGCVLIEDYIVADTCNNGPLPCDTLSETFYIDVYTTSEAEICLPTNETNLEDFNLQLDGVPYDRPLGDCGATTNFYDGLDMLPGAGDYTLVEWTHDNDKVENVFCQSLQELAEHLNQYDPQGNWVLDGGTVFGGAQGSVYGNLKIKHNQSGSVLDLPPSKLSIPHPTILVDIHSPTHILVSQHPSLGCLDTLYINLLPPPAPVTDTIQVNVSLGGTETVCIPVDELYGTIEFLSNQCISFTGNAQVNSTDTTCVEVVGVDEGIDQACIVVCDDFGICDTTVLLINVGDVNTNVVVHNGFSPNNDGVNDFFVVDNIEQHPKNQLEIYNRWGKQVYKVKRYRNEWQGEYRNSKLPDGTYFYVLRVDVDGVEKEFKGFVEIRR